MTTPAMAMGVDMIHPNFADTGTRSAHSHDLHRLKGSTKFDVSEQAEPHAVRRKMILKQYPEIQGLFGSDIGGAGFCALTIAVQFFMMWLVRDWSFLYWALATYFVSGTLNHSLFLAMHEVSHDLFFSSRGANRAFSYFINLPMGVPASAYFRVYHRAHHTDLGDRSQDTDIPTVWEAKLLKGRIGRFVFLCIQPLAYIIRPLFIKPIPISRDILFGSICQYSFDLFTMYYLGWKSFGYLIVGSLLGGSLHPMAGHFIAEHYEFISGQSTYSYYGPLNWLTYNAGYHVEHHDFPCIPGSRLHLLRKIAPEWYNLPSYDSWVKVMVYFVLNDKMSLFCRATRRSPDS